MRTTRASMPEASVVLRYSMNPNPSFDTSSSGAILRMTSRDFGPTTAIVLYCSVAEVNTTSSSGHSVCDQSSSHSRTSAAPPVVVVMKKWSSAKRRVTPSSNTMPSGVHMTP